MARSKEYELAIKIAGEVEKSFTQAMGTSQKELSGLKKAASDISAGLQSGFGDIDKAFSPLKETAGKVFDGIVKAAAAAGAGIAAGLGFSVAVGSDFEAQMSTVGAIAQASAEDMDSLTATAEHLGATTQFTAKEVGEAMEYMAMAGWKTDDINGSIAGVMDLAAASGEEIGTVSDIVTDAMTAFGLSADQATHFADVLAQASSNANTNVGMMGETFKYAAPVAGAMGYSVEDTALAIGLMANQGIKASQAGTALRSIMTNLASPSDKAAGAMHTLGITLTDDEGRAKSLYDIMLDFRTGMSGMVEPTEEQIAALAELEEQYNSGALTEEEFAAQQDDMMAKIYGAEGALKAEAAAAIAGRYGMSGLLAIVNSSDEDFDKLAAAINNADGAAANMAARRLDNLAGDVTLFKSALDGLGIEIYGQISSPLRDAVSAGTELLTAITGDIADSELFGGMADAFGNFITGLQERLPSVKQDIGDFVDNFSSIVEPVKNVGGWLIDHPDVIAGLFTGIGTAIVSYNLLQGIPSIVTAFTNLGAVLTNPWAVAILGVSGAIGVLFGVMAGIKAKQADERAKDLAAHFGTISLKLSDMQTAAQMIVDNGSLGNLSDALSAFERSEDAISAMDSAVQTLNKASWKVSIGMELTEQEASEYQSAVSSYVTSIQSWIDEQSYGVSLSMSVLTGDTEEDSLAGKAVDKVKQFYQGKQTELADLGKQLNEYVTKAFNDGLLDIDEAKHIQELQQQMADIQSALASSGLAASLERIGMGYSGAALTPESFQSMQTEINEAVAEAKKAYDEAFEYDVAALKTAYTSEGSTMTLEEYNAGLVAIRKGYLDNLAQIELQGQQFSLNTIFEAYGDELREAAPEFEKLIDETMTGIMTSPKGVTGMWEWLDSVAENDVLDASTRGNIAKLMENLAPTTEELENLRDRYHDFGIKVPESVSDGLKDAAALAALTGDTKAVYTLMADELVNAPEYAELVSIATSETAQIPEAIGNALTNAQAQATINAAVDREYQSTSAYLQQIFSQGFDVSVPVRVNAQTTTTDGPKYPNLQYRHADGAIVTHPEIAEIGEGGDIESVIPWNNSARAADLWLRTGEGIGAFGNGGLVDDLLSNDTDTGGMTITYSPVINFNGGTPSREDIVEAGRISQREFNAMMAQYERDRRRVSFGR